jgi:hypothetical protein
MKNNLTVVFSSQYDDEKNLKFIEHIKNSIGLKPNDYNIVLYKNNNEFSLTSLYNKALGDYNGVIVFCHNDIIFKTKGWGKIIQSKLRYSDYGIVGVAGTKKITESGVWWEDKSELCGIVEHSNGIETWVSAYGAERKGQITPVVVVDGVFMAVDTTKIKHKFDENFKGFHYYDIDFCFENYLSGVEIGVTTDIRITHMSVGHINEQWEHNKRLFIMKYCDELPCSYENV